MTFPYRSAGVDQLIDRVSSLLGNLPATFKVSLDTRAAFKSLLERFKNTWYGFLGLMSAQPSSERSDDIPEEYRSSGHYQETDRPQNQHRLPCLLGGKGLRVASSSAKVSYGIPARSFSCTPQIHL
jgi:hypothetical protein